MSDSRNFTGGDDEPQLKPFTMMYGKGGRQMVLIVGDSYRFKQATALLLNKRFFRVWRSVCSVWDYMTPHVTVVKLRQDPGWRAEWL